MLVFDESRLQQARLFPITGIKGGLDQERRSTSALLAVLKIVPELTYSLLSESGAPKGAIETFIEPEFKVNKKSVRPDGFIVITRGKKVWRALVEVKTGSNELNIEQINPYLDLCRDFKIDALITISNQVLNASGNHPTNGVDLRKLRSTRLEHFSWLRILTDSIVLSEHTGVEDLERGFILKELIRFLQSKESGAAEFNDMSTNWVSVREGIRVGTFRKPDDDILEVVSRFESLMRYSAFTLSARLGVKAKEVTPRLAKDDYKRHLFSVGQQLIDNKVLTGHIEIPGAASKLELEADLASGHLHCRFQVDAPQDVRNKSRVTWILRQLKNSPQGTTLSWTYKRARSSERPLLISDIENGNFELELDKSKEISLFTVDVVSKMGSKRLAGQGSFIDSVVTSIEVTYGELLQRIKPWQQPAPKMSSTVTELIPDEIRAEES